MYLIDSNILIRFFSENLPNDVMDFIENVLDKSFNISFINRIEVLGYHALTAENISKLEETFEVATEYKINERLIEKAIIIARTYNIKTADAIIAATAIENNLTLLSNDARFNRLASELKILNPLIQSHTFEVRESLRDFHSLEHRLEFVANVKG